MEYLLHIVILVGIYSILSVSANLIVGYAGMLTVAHAAFYGIGAYVTALMALGFHSSLIVNTLCAVALTVLLGTAVAVPALRVRGDYFMIATFAFQVITFGTLNNLVSLTGGPMGLAGIPRPTIIGLEISSRMGIAILVGIACALTLWICNRVVRSPFGRVLKAVREDEIFAQACGKDVSRYKVLVVVIGAGMASTAGMMYAYYVSFIDPSSFTVLESILILSMVIIGGAGSLWGPVLGASALVVLPELLRLIGLPGAVAANLRQIMYGALLVAFMMWRPKGLLGEYAFHTGEDQK